LADRRKPQRRGGQGKSREIGDRLDVGGVSPLTDRMAVQRGICFAHYLICRRRRTEKEHCRAEGRVTEKGHSDSRARSPIRRHEAAEGEQQFVNWVRRKKDENISQQPLIKWGKSNICERGSFASTPGKTFFHPYVDGSMKAILTCRSIHQIEIRNLLLRGLVRGSSSSKASSPGFPV